jgi:hypothetical protein
VRAALLAALAALHATGSSAGAWTRPQGETFLSGSTTYYRVDGSDAYAEATAALYGEYGLREGLTVGGAAEIKQPTGSGEADEGDITLFAFAQARLREGAAGDPLSAQIGLELPFGADLIPQSSGDPALDLRLLYGRGFATPLGDAFFDLQGAVRLRFGDDADELRVDLTAGIRPAARWLLLAQSFSTIGLRNARPGGDDYDVVKIAPSIGYEIVEGVTVLLGAEREVYGRDVETGTRGRLAVWTTF